MADGNDAPIPTQYLGLTEDKIYAVFRLNDGNGPPRDVGVAIYPSRDGHNIDSISMNYAPNDPNATSSIYNVHRTDIEPNYSGSPMEHDVDHSVRRDLSRIMAHPEFRQTPVDATPAAGRSLFQRLIPFGGNSVSLQDAMRADAQRFSDMLYNTIAAVPQALWQPRNGGTFVSGDSAYGFVASDGGPAHLVDPWAFGERLAASASREETAVLPASGAGPTNVADRIRGVGPAVVADPSVTPAKPALSAGSDEAAVVRSNGTINDVGEWLQAQQAGTVSHADGAASRSAPPPLALPAVPVTGGQSPFSGIIADIRQGYDIPVQPSAESSAAPPPVKPARAAQTPPARQPTPPVELSREAGAVDALRPNAAASSSSQQELSRTGGFEDLRQARIAELAREERQSRETEANAKAAEAKSEAERAQHNLNEKALRVEEAGVDLSVLERSGALLDKTNRESINTAQQRADTAQQREKVAKINLDKANLDYKTLVARQKNEVGDVVLDSDIQRAKMDVENARDAHTIARDNSRHTSAELSRLRDTAAKQQATATAATNEARAKFETADHELNLSVNEARSKATQAIAAQNAARMPVEAPLSEQAVWAQEHGGLAHQADVDRRTVFARTPPPLPAPPKTQAAQTVAASGPDMAATAVASIAPAPAVAPAPTPIATPPAPPAPQPPGSIQQPIGVRVVALAGSPPPAQHTATLAVTEAPAFAPSAPPAPNPAPAPPTPPTAAPSQPDIGKVVPNPSEAISRLEPASPPPGRAGRLEPQRAAAPVNSTTNTPSIYARYDRFAGKTFAKAMAVRGTVDTVKALADGDYARAGTTGSLTAAMAASQSAKLMERLPTLINGAKNVPVVGAVVSAAYFGFNVTNSIIDAARGEAPWAKVGTTALSNGAAIVGGFFGFGWSTAAEQAVVEASKLAGEKYAPQDAPLVGIGKEIYSFATAPGTPQTFTAPPSVADATTNGAGKFAVTGLNTNLQAGSETPTTVADAPSPGRTGRFAELRLADTAMASDTSGQQANSKVKLAGDFTPATPGDHGYSPAAPKGKKLEPDQQQPLQQTKIASAAAPSLA